MFGDECVDRRTVEQGEDLDVAFGVVVAHVEPELVELVGRRIARIEPHVAALGLAELGAVGLRDERAGDRIGFGAQLAADQLGAGGDVAPLVGSAQLHLAAVFLVEVHEIETLHQLVGEFGERHAVALAVETFLDRILGHHVVDRDQLADVTDEVEEADPLHPVVVVDHQCGVGGVGVEVDEFGQLPLDRLLIAAQRLLVEQVALLRLARRIADHARCAADQCDGTVAAHLEMFENHHSHQMSDMQRVGRGIDTQIGRRHLFFKLFLCARHDRVDHAAPFQFLDEVLDCHIVFVLIFSCFRLFHFQIELPAQFGQQRILLVHVAEPVFEFDGAHGPDLLVDRHLQFERPLHAGDRGDAGEHLQLAA